jgi:hypothetical protein
MPGGVRTHEIPCPEEFVHTRYHTPLHDVDEYRSSRCRISVWDADVVYVLTLSHGRSRQLLYKFVIYPTCYANSARSH